MKKCIFLILSLLSVNIIDKKNDRPKVGYIKTEENQKDSPPKKIGF